MTSVNDGIFLNCPGDKEAAWEEEWRNLRYSLYHRYGIGFSAHTMQFVQRLAGLNIRKGRNGDPKCPHRDEYGISKCDHCTRQQAKYQCAFGVLWLLVHNFWERMIAGQPNDMTSSEQEFKEAVALVCDINAMRVQIAIGDDGSHEFIGGGRPAEELRRYCNDLWKLSYILFNPTVFEAEEPVSLCKAVFLHFKWYWKSVSLCKCTYDLQRFNDKSNLHIRVCRHYNPGVHDEGCEDNDWLFNTRDVACLLGMDDLIQSVRDSGWSHLPSGPISAMTEDLRKYFSDGVYETDEAMLRQWCEVLRKPEVRDKIRKELEKMIAEAVALHKKKKRNAIFRNGKCKECYTWRGDETDKGQEIAENRRRFYDERLDALEALALPSKKAFLELYY